MSFSLEVDDAESITWINAICFCPKAAKVSYKPSRSWYSCGSMTLYGLCGDDQEAGTGMQEYTTEWPPAAHLTAHCSFLCPSSGTIWPINFILHSPKQIIEWVWKNHIKRHPLVIPYSMNVVTSSQHGLSAFIYSFNVESPHWMDVITLIQYGTSSGCRFMWIFHIHSMISLGECTLRANIESTRRLHTSVVAFELRNFACTVFF